MSKMAIAIVTIGSQYDDEASLLAAIVTAVGVLSITSTLPRSQVVPCGRDVPA